MNRPRWQVKPQRLNTRIGALILSLGLGVALLPVLLFQSQEEGSTNRKTASFEAALQFVKQEGETLPGTIPATPRRYGISQRDYDQLRLRQNRRTQDISKIQQSEVRAIYRAWWNEAQCDRYQPPLDVACLDSVAQFGVVEGLSFFAGLPQDPQQAAIEVANRRQDYRQRLLARSPAAAPDIQAGIERDQELRDFVATNPGLNASTQPPISTILNPPNNPILNSPDRTSDNPVDRPGNNSANRSDREPENKRATNPILRWLQSALPGGDESEQDRQSLTQDEIYTRAKPFTVEVWVTTGNTRSPASGIILTPSGLVLTNYHVVANDTTFPIHLSDGREFSGTVIAKDAGIDLALLQIDSANDLPVAPLAENTVSVQVGDIVYAIGAPYGQHWKMTQSEVIELNSLCAHRSSPLRCIRTPNRFLRPGNSGGPLLDTTGRVIGINRAIQESTGEGVSIPIEVIRQFVDSTELGIALN